MARGYTTRKLQVFALHVRMNNKAPNYADLFQGLASMQPEKRTATFDEKMVAIPILEIEGDSAWLVAYEGERDVNPLIFNTREATERIEKLRSGEIVAHKTHVIIDITRRHAIVEYNHRGAKALDIANVLEDSLRGLYSQASVSFELNPFADEAFAKSIDRFSRIRLASIRIARPNVDWTDHYNHLTAVAQDSDARTMEVELSAGRGGSLSRARGIVRYIRELARAPLSTLKGARITGTRTGEDEETTVSMTHFIEHQKVGVRMTPDGHVQQSDIKRKLRSFLLARRNKQKVGRQ